MQRTPLLIAAEEGHTALGGWLLDQGADPEAQDEGGDDVLFKASYGGHTAIVSVLLDRGIDINRPAGGGWVPLMAAASIGHVAVVELLLSRKEIEIDHQHDDGGGTVDDGGGTALYVASEDNHSEVIGLLLQAGADPRIATNDGRTPLDIVRERGK